MQRDEFFWLSAINKATVVVNRAEGLIGDDTARLAARGIRAVEEAAAADPAKRVKTYITYEPLLIEATSPEVTLIHAGRSSHALDRAHGDRPRRIARLCARLRRRA